MIDPQANNLNVSSHHVRKAAQSVHISCHREREHFAILVCFFFDWLKAAADNFFVFNSDKNLLTYFTHFLANAQSMYIRLVYHCIKRQGFLYQVLIIDTFDLLYMAPPVVICCLFSRYRGRLKLLCETLENENSKFVYVKNMNSLLLLSLYDW